MKTLSVIFNIFGVCAIIGAFITFPVGTIPAILFTIMWFALAGVCGNSSHQGSQLISEVVALREQQFQLGATPEMKAERARNIEAKRQQDRQASVIKWSVLGGLTLFLVVCAHIGGNKTEATPTPSALVESTPYPAATPDDMHPIATPAPTVTGSASLLRLMMVSPGRGAVPAPSIASDSYIPGPTIKEALVAFNELQDQYGRPHINRLQYTAKTDSYSWIGPKLGRKVVMLRGEFNIEVWNDYYKKQHSSQ
jgi:hypothetical protein